MVSEIGIKCFLAAANNGSFTKTAEELYMTRQAVSKQIARLEKELGTKLFERSTAKVEITPTGSLYVSFFTTVQKEWTKTRYLAQSLELKQKNTVRIGSPYDMNVRKKIFQAMEKCRAEGLDLQLQWERAETVDLVRMLLENRLDVIVSFERSLDEVEGAREALDMQFYAMVSAYLTVSQRNASYSSHAVPSDFAGEECYMVKGMFPENAKVEDFRREWKKYGLTIQDVRFVSNRDTMKTMVELGAGFTICTDLDSFTETSGIKTIPLNRKLEIYTIWRKSEQNTPVLAFLDELNRLNS